MDIEKLKIMNWKEKRDLVKTTNDPQILITLADDKSILVRKAILANKDAPLEAIDKVYSSLHRSCDKLKAFNAIWLLKPSEELRKLLSKMVSDSDSIISQLAIEVYRKKFKTLKLDTAKSKNICHLTDQDVLEDLAIQLPGYAEQSELAENTNLTGENAHKFVVTLLACEKDLCKLQKLFYEIFSHTGILPKTAECILEKTFMESSDEYFYSNPKFSVVRYDKATPEKLDELLDLLEKEMKLYIPPNATIKQDTECFFKFVTSLAANPNLSKTTYDKAFDLFVKQYKLEWSSYIETIVFSKYLTKEQLIYILREHPKGYCIFSYASEKICMLNENEFVEIISSYTDSQKKWLKTYATSLSTNFISYLSN